MTLQPLYALVPLYARRVVLASNSRPLLPRCWPLLLWTAH